MSNPEAIADAFIAHYYTCLDQQNYTGLSSLYQATSTLSFEGTQHTGPQAIPERWRQIGKLSHNPQMTKDAQVVPNGLILFITGQLNVDGGNPMQFSQVFQLIATGPGSYYVQNELFRLIYC